MYTGFGRLVILHEIKIKYLYVCLAQEVLLHNLPLTILMVYNNILLSKKFKLDIAAFSLAGLNLLQIVIELTYFRCNLNKGINLEQRIKFTSVMRSKDIAKIGVISTIFGVVSLVLGWYAFKN